MPNSHDPYANWTHDDLVKRVMQLESQLRSRTSDATSDRTAPVQFTTESTHKQPKAKREFDSSRYTTHRIALKFAYLGKRYNGFEHHVNNTTPLTTVEEELWRAMMKTRLIFPSPQEERHNGDDTEGNKQPGQHWEGSVHWTGCEYSKCGRTDRGVSAFGQVVALRVRSNRPIEPIQPSPNPEAQESDVENTGQAATEKQFDPLRDEINYPALLNHVLPPDIRILAWCPAPTPTFSARFSCKERRYKYFFTQPAMLPLPVAEAQRAYLDIDKMRKAASYLIGAHDFRNFCKVDASKQITNFTRRITHASIDRVSVLDVPSFMSATPFRQQEVNSECAEVYALSLHGTAFLWHQVRCIMAVLLLVGQGLEQPEVILEMLDMAHQEKGRPKYDMAHETPLVLWDCIFPLRPDDDQGKPYETGETIDDAVPWIYTSHNFLSGQYPENASKTDGHWGRSGLMNSLWQTWKGRKMDEILAAALMDKAVRPGVPSDVMPGFENKSTFILDGGDSSRPIGRYVPLMQRDRMEPVEVVNERYARKYGLSSRKPESAQDGIDADE